MDDFPPVEKRLQADGHTLYRIERAGDADPGSLSKEEKRKTRASTLSRRLSTYLTLALRLTCA
jgi:hypothetical protein